MMPETSLSRRQALTALSAGVATVALPGCAAKLAAGTSVQGDASASALLDSIANNLLRLSPEGATSLALDIGANADLRSKLGDRGQAGQEQLALTLRADLARVEAVDTASLTHAVRTSVEVVKSAYRTSLEGFAQPYGDVSVGGWRNTPYVVIQNVGAYLDTPRFLDSDHPVKTATDAEAYLARLESLPVQLAGELGRIQEARAKGLIPPAFLLDKADKQLAASLKGAMEGGGLVESLVRRTKEANIAGDWGARATGIVKGKIAPALEAQLAELRLQRRSATMDAGLWARPGGDAFYA